LDNLNWKAEFHINQKRLTIQKYKNKMRETVQQFTTCVDIERNAINLFHSINSCFKRILLK
jgi:hypothetical protein